MSICVGATLSVRAQTGVSMIASVEALGPLIRGLRSFDGARKRF